MIDRQPPHNMEAEQALLGAILVNNEAINRVSSFLEPQHFFDPLHQQIFETAAKLILAGKQATPITLKTFFENAEPISATLTVPQYLGTLAANATTIINAQDYGRTVYDLATRRALIVYCEDALVTAYDSPVDASPADQLHELHGHIEVLRSTCSPESLSVSRCLADVEAQAISWFWLNRIALGKLGLIAGVPGLGKSQFACAMVAAATTGGRLPDGEEAPLGSAIIITTEDDAADTIRPRLEAAGADLTKVHLFDWALGSARDGRPELQHFNVGAHGAALAELVRKIGDVNLIVIDPISAHLGKTDSHVTAEVRGALAPLQTLAAECGAAILLISHLNKGSADSSAMNRVNGSGAFIAVCRSAWLIAPDPKDTDNRRRMFVPLKNNIGDDKTGFAFTIEGTMLPNGIATSRVVFEPFRVFVSADDLLRQAKPGAEAARSALDEACEFLKEELARGPRPVKDIATAAREADVKHDTLKRARKALGTKKRKLGKVGRWWIGLPHHDLEGVEEAEGADLNGIGGMAAASRREAKVPPPKMTTPSAPSTSCTPSKRSRAKVVPIRPNGNASYTAQKSKLPPRPASADDGVGDDEWGRMEDD